MCDFHRADEDFVMLHDRFGIFDIALRKGWQDHSNTNVILCEHVLYAKDVIVIELVDIFPEQPLP